MPSVTEAAGAAGLFDGAMRQGLGAIDRSTQITFTCYRRTILPADGYLFWTATGQAITVEGSIHYESDIRQTEDETIAVNRVIFTCSEEVQVFNAIAPNTIWIGQLGAMAASSGPLAPGVAGFSPSPVVFAFSSRGSFYREADTYHYVGVAVQPVMLAQLISTPADLPTSPIVSNSLPIWLALTQFGPVYPSFLVPQNAEPPYIVAHIPPESTEALQAFPNYNQGITTNPSPPPIILPGTVVPNSGASPLYQQPSSQLTAETVRLTLYGFNNQTALQFVTYLLQYSLDTDAFGVMNMPIIRDEKRVQEEITSLAQKKTIEFRISYYQSAADAIARRLILSVLPTYLPQSL